MFDLIEYGIDNKVDAKLYYPTEEDESTKYQRVSIVRRKDRNYVMKLHRLVVLSYLNLPDNYETELTIHHLDGNVQNNHINNLLLINEEDHKKLHLEEINGRDGFDYIMKWRNIMERIRKGERYLLSMY